MANMVKFQVKGNAIEFDVDKLTPEVKVLVLTKGLSRIFFERETPEKKEGDLAAAIVKVQADPNAYYVTYGHRGEGVARPKLDIYERKAKSWFSAEFLPALKLGHEKAKAIWGKAGGITSVFKAKDDATVEAKAEARKNLDARDKLCAAKAKKLKDSGWEPELA